MKKHGLICGLNRNQIRPFLRFIASRNYKPYVSYSMLTDESNGAIVPCTVPGKMIDFEELSSNENFNIWELGVNFYWPGDEVQTFETYEEFLLSTCIGCVLFYDCQKLEIYLKDSSQIELFKDTLLSLGAKDVSVIDESNLFRTIMCT